jgi:hypothetical protein
MDYGPEYKVLSIYIVLIELETRKAVEVKNYLFRLTKQMLIPLPITIAVIVHC